MWAVTPGSTASVSARWKPASKEPSFTLMSRRPSSAAVSGSNVFSGIEPASSLGGSTSPRAPGLVLAVTSANWTT